MTMEPLHCARPPVRLHRPSRARARARRCHPQRPTSRRTGRVRGSRRLEETLEILSDAAAMVDIREAHNEVARGEVIKGVAAACALTDHEKAPTGTSVAPAKRSHCPAGVARQHVDGGWTGGGPACDSGGRMTGHWTTLTTMSTPAVEPSLPPAAENAVRAHAHQLREIAAEHGMRMYSDRVLRKPHVSPGLVAAQPV